MNSTDTEKLSEREVALIDAIRTIADIMLAADIVPVSTFDRLFAHHRDGYLGKGLVQAAGTMEIIRQLTTDPQAEASRQLIRKTLRESPKGSA
jgi:hypothetical protein